VVLLLLVVQYIRGNGTVVAVAVHYVAPREGTRTLYNIHHAHTRPRASFGYAVVRYTHFVRRVPRSTQYDRCSQSSSDVCAARFVRNDIRTIPV